MSFSKEVKAELDSIQIKSNCCKKAYIFGALMASSVSENHISLKVSDENCANRFSSLLKTIYKCECNVKKVKRGCYEAYELDFDSKKLAEFLNFADSFNREQEHNTFFSCNNCREVFLRALFCAAGSVSDPQKTYSLEIRIPNEKRAEFISNIIEERGINVPSSTKRSGVVGLFYRNESSIEDFINACGGNNILFSFLSASVEKNLRNDENRATNCVAKNISKSVEATALQVAAIDSLKATCFFDDLPREIKQSALLRLENPDISLSELAALHEPPISKSGLNHRLAKIIEEARKRNLI